MTQSLLMTSSGGWLKITQTNDGGQTSDITSQHFFPFSSCTHQNIMGKGVKSLHHKTGFILLVSASLCSILLCHRKWFGNLFSSAIHNNNIFVWLVPPVSGVLLNRSHHVHSFHDFAKHHVPAIVLQLEVLVSELLSVN